MEKSNTIFPDSLILCRKIESSFLALKKFEKGVPLKEKDKNAIKDAVSFLNNAKYGKIAIENLELSKKAISASFDFKEAFSATVRTNSDTDADKDKIIKILDKFIKILNDIIEGKFKDKDILDKLISFFYTIRENNLQSIAGSFDKFVFGVI